jgi:hypothetical protein
MVNSGAERRLRWNVSGSPPSRSEGGASRRLDVGVKITDKPG